MIIYLSILAPRQKLHAWFQRDYLNFVICCLSVLENSVDGPTFKTLTDRDLKDLLPSFLLRKKIREWAQSLVSLSRIRG